MDDGTVVDEDGDMLENGDSESEECVQVEAGKDIEASNDSKDDETAPDYKLQKPDAALLPQAVTKVSSLAPLTSNTK